MKFLLVLMMIGIVKGCDVDWNCQRCTEDCFFVMLEDGEHMCLDSYSPALHGLMEILAPGSGFFCPPPSGTASPTTKSSSVAPSSSSTSASTSTTPLPSTSTSSSTSTQPPTNEKTSSLPPFAIVGIVAASTMIAVVVIFLLIKYMKTNHVRLHEEMYIDDFV